MIFPYLDVNRGGAVRRHPIVPISIHGPGGNRQIYALVDSGAEHSVFSLDVAESLRLSTNGALAVEIVGVGGRAGRGYLLDVKQQLQAHQWVGPAVFSNVMQMDAPMILGQSGFFEYFTVAFKRRRWQMDIRRAR